MQKSYERNPSERRDHKEDAPIYKPNKSLIILKSSVIGLFIVLVVLIFTFIIVKSKHQKALKTINSNCIISRTIEIDKKIEKYETQNGVVTILTQLDKKTGKQEIIRLDAACGHVINRIIFKINKPLEVN